MTGDPYLLSHWDKVSPIRAEAMDTEKRKTSKIVDFINAPFMAAPYEVREGLTRKQNGFAGKVACAEPELRLWLTVA